jgi:predicted transcriptional regulator
MSIPRVFISYSHDSQEHKKWVLDLATRLRNTGIDAILDQWELTPGADIPHFMETQLASANYILMICTDEYVKKANLGVGGVGYEKMMITAEVMKSIESTKVIPIIKQNGTRNVPTFLQSKYSINLSNNDSFEFNYDELIRKFHGAPLYEKPEIGNNPFTPTKDLIVDKTNDEIKEIMKIIVYLFENSTENYIHYSEIIRNSKTSRIMTDIILKRMLDEGLINNKMYGNSAPQLTDKGKYYAIEHKLIK